MKRNKKPYRKQKVKGKNLLFFFIMLPIVALTVYVMLHPQSIRQFAADGPPLFGCLHTGQADPTICGTRMGQEGKNALQVNGRAYVGQIIYYNDTISGSFTYKNVGDQPINIQNYGIAAGAFKRYTIATFSPLDGAKTLNPGEELSGSGYSYTFKTGDPDEGWVVGPGITNTDGQPLPITNSSTDIRVDSTCTALRVKPLTAKDKSNVTALCSKDPKNILCTSRQYCELFKGGQCTGPVLGEAREGQQCDANIVLDQKEQDVLEQLCKAYPDSDACTDFCKRALGSKICPEKLLWFDKNEKQVFPQPAKYIADADFKAVAGAKTVLGSNTSAMNAVGQSCRVAGDICDPPSNCVGNGSTVGTCVAPAQKPGAPKVNPFPPKPAAPGVDKRSSDGYKPSCASHRANNTGQCCASDFPLINGCCQPGCFVYHSAPASRNNCQYRSKSGACCAQDSVEKYGYCQPAQVPKGGAPLPGESAIPRDTNKIYPPTYKAPTDTSPGIPPAKANDCTPAEVAAGICGNKPAPVPPVQPPANNPAAPYDPSGCSKNGTSLGQCESTCSKSSNKCGNGDYCSANQSCHSGYCDNGVCSNPPGYCIAAGQSTNIAGNCCSGSRDSNGVCK